MGVRVRLGELHLNKVQSVLTHVCAHLAISSELDINTLFNYSLFNDIPIIMHLLYADGALSDGVEGLRVVVVHEVGRVIVGLCATVVLG